MCQQLHPARVMAFLDDLYNAFDHLLDHTGCYKVETIGGRRAGARDMGEMCTCVPGAVGGRDRLRRLWQLSGMHNKHLCCLSSLTRNSTPQPLQTATWFVAASWAGRPPPA